MIKHAQGVKIKGKRVHIIKQKHVWMSEKTKNFAGVLSTYEVFIYL